MTLQSIFRSNKNYGVGFTFEITNPKDKKKVVAYLIGTSHFVDGESLRKSNFQQIVDKCSALYSEVGTDLFITSAHGSRPEGDHEYINVTHRFCDDAEITLEAWIKRIPIISLDKGVPEMALWRDSTRSRRHAAGPDQFEEWTMNHQTSQIHIRAIQAWEEGNAKFWAARRKAAENVPAQDGMPPGHVLVKEREDHWMEILVPKLRETQKPICIAVGAAHVVGVNSLPDRFKKAGFKVERMYSTPRSNL